MKPQLGIMIPVALIAAGQWRAFASAGLTTLALAIAGTLAFGWDYWPAMLDMGAQHFARMQAEVATDGQLISAYSGLAGLGLPERAAMAGQIGIAIVAAIGVFVAWRNLRRNFDLAAAMLFAATLFTSPYLWHYEAAFLAPLALFLIRAGVLRPTLPGTLATALLWLGVGPAMLAHLIIGNNVVSIRLFTLPVTTLALAITLAGVLMGRRRTPLSQGGH